MRQQSTKGNTSFPRVHSHADLLEALEGETKSLVRRHPRYSQWWGKNGWIVNVFVSSLRPSPMAYLANSQRHRAIAMLRLITSDPDLLQWPQVI